ncbi:MAG: hypothetical protein GXP52_08445 [Deltaproteobacteria bacterium]|nr:hypothetical protein [Deltaproteobacteria bacterium]
MRISRSGHYAWRKRGKSLRQRERDRLIPVVREAHRLSKGTYGACRIAKELEARGEPCGRTKAGTLMDLANVSVRRGMKFKATTDSKHDLPVAPNLLERRFDVGEPDRVWVSDITYVWTFEGRLYLAVVLDLFPARSWGGPSAAGSTESWSWMPCSWPFAYDDPVPA